MDQRKGSPADFTFHTAAAGNLIKFIGAFINESAVFHRPQDDILLIVFISFPLVRIDSGGRHNIPAVRGRLGASRCLKSGNGRPGAGIMIHTGAPVSVLASVFSGTVENITVKKDHSAGFDLRGNLPTIVKPVGGWCAVIFFRFIMVFCRAKENRFCDFAGSPKGSRFPQWHRPWQSRRRTWNYPGFAHNPSSWCQAWPGKPGGLTK